MALSKKVSTHYSIFLLLKVILFTCWLFVIPPDEKNAFFLGFSLSRWGLILVLFILSLPLILDGLLFHRLISSITRWLHTWFSVAHPRWFAEGLAFLLYLVVFYPADRIPTLSAYVLRIRPLLLFVILLLWDLFLLAWSETTTLTTVWQSIKQGWHGYKKDIQQVFLLLVACLLPLVLLKISNATARWPNLIFSAGPPLLSSQVVALIALFVFGAELFLALCKNRPVTNKVSAIIFVALWLLSFAVLLNTTFVCQGDRPGPFPPNQRCYPQVDDASYSIGSYYVLLGEGVNNGWFTDKPLYLVVLAFAQWVLGPAIDQYVLFQVGLIALLPAFLFLLGHTLSDLWAGVCLALLSLLLEVNHIRLYGSMGGVNVYLLNTELLTGLLLVILCLCLVAYHKNRQAYHWPILCGALLALLSLTRLNGLFLLPALLVYLLVLPAAQRGKNRKPLRGFALCLIAFGLVFIPAQLSLRDDAGTPHMVTKLREVIRFRYTTPDLQSLSPQFTANHLPGMIAYPVAHRLRNHIPPISNRINRMASSPTTDQTSHSPIKLIEIRGTSQPRLTSWIEDLTSAALVFANNLYLSLLKLPVNFQLLSPAITVKQPILASSRGIMLWAKPISLENWIALSLNSAIVILGLIDAIKHRVRAGGALPLIIFLVYHASNAAAMTAGDRYLQPVSWVILLWFVAGWQKLFVLATKAMPGIPQKHPQGQQLGVLQLQIAKTSIIRHLPAKILLSVLFTVACALLFPLLGLSSDGLPTREQEDLAAFVAETVAKHNLQSLEALSPYLDDPALLLVEGVAYHPRKYASPILSSVNEPFELTVLAKERVYISNYFGRYEPIPFTDGSHVILIGCRIREANFWNIDHTLMRTFGIIQLDNEQAVYLNPFFRFPCD